MAKIKLKTGDPIHCEEEWAKKVLNQKQSIYVKAGDPIEVAPGRFELKSAITGVELGGGEMNSGGLDLNNPEIRNKVKEFERELLDISDADPEKKGYEFDFWCQDRGYAIGGQVKRYHYTGSFGGEPRWYKQLENYSVRSDIDKGYELKRALDNLRDRRAYAKKQEHLAELSSLQIDKCPLDEVEPCKICHPSAQFKIPKGIVKSMPKVETQNYVLD